jgi:hypothetical protein
MGRTPRPGPYTTQEVTLVTVPMVLLPILVGLEGVSSFLRRWTPVLCRESGSVRVVMPGTCELRGSHVRCAEER